MKGELYEKKVNYAATLQEQVKGRTAELENIISEIERMNKFFVGRQLRMVELKEKIKELEGQVAGRGRETNEAASKKVNPEAVKHMRFCQ